MLRDWLMSGRGLFAGFGYVATVTLALTVSWAVQGVVNDLTDHSAIATFREFFALWTTLLVAVSPGTLVIVIGANAAPRGGVRRFAWLVTAAALMVVCCSSVIWLWLREPPELMDLLQSMVTAMLLVTACAYRSSARTATSLLMQRQIESAAIDADAKRARLQLLRAQIEPHFLFNTLATVRTLARLDRAMAVEMLDNLMRYLSEALPKLRQDESSLAQELALVEAFLRIHQIRMGARLSYELCVPQYLGTERIPTMLLLTLVENALKHGINPAVDGGSIHVSAARERNALVLKVTDSGCGMTATEGHGVGLANARMRLTMLYGDGARLSLAHAQSRGVIATVSIPAARAS